VLDELLKRAERALFLTRVARGTRALSFLGPGGLAKLVKSARRTKLGPHVAVMFHAAAHPDKEALVEYAEGWQTNPAAIKRFTWAQLDATVNRLAHALAARGARGGSRVAIMLPNGSEYLIAQQALARLGATAVQIGYRLKPAEIAFILGNAEPVVTIVHGDYVAAIEDARAQAKQSGPMIVVGGTDGNSWDRALAAAEPELPPVSRDGDGGGVIVYTSGTTGKPKGANRSWKKTGFESVADMVLQVGITADDRHLCVCPLYHSAAPAFVAIMASLGATIVLMDHFEPEGALAIIEREKITCTMMVPTMLIRMANLPEATLAKYRTGSLRWVMSGAAPLTTDAARRFMAAFGRVLWNFYGATETGLVTLAGPDDHLTRPGTIGKKLRGNQIRLLADDGHEVEAGGIGELYARNATLMSGYHNNDEATSEAQRDGYVSVGDLGRLDEDGYYFLESRKHDMVISGGVNIYPREIEDHLVTHPAILEAAVVGIPDPEWGETLRAFIVLRDGTTMSEAEVIDFCRRDLADFKRPRSVAFLPELPRNPTGKVLKRELRDLRL
jgi:fatty-acyl-CoA synthase